MSGCAEIRASLGVYVVGAIEPAERARLEEHLAGCPACRDELAAFAGLPALLGRVDEEQIREVAGPPEELLESLLARAGEERRRPSRWIPLAMAACVLLLVGGLFGGLLTSLGDDRHVSAPPPVQTTTAASPGPSPAEPPGEKITAENPRTGVKGYAILRARKSGTHIELYLSGAPYGDACRFQVVARDGQKDSLGSWNVAYKGKGYGEYKGVTRFPRDQLYSLEINTLDGRPLLMFPA
ncbi:anti-sigma factor family protein [Actinomadura hibisca]|uniref:anti-sigma factor family protein n=1 Tax=Actinomadura hibisca TaxID=68565 RepID=UPI0008308AD8|nr:anti-sigma factor [Actinomadura hibisca]